jgi:uncharacterized protein (DUF58 family)
VEAFVKKIYVISFAAILLISLGITVGFAKIIFQISGPAKATITSFTIAHPALRPGEQTSVRVSVEDDAGGPLTFAWKAEAGTFIASDTNPVIWTAPESEGHYQVSVEVTSAARSKARGSASILVSKYPANPLVMSVDPVGYKTAKQ